MAASERDADDLLRRGFDEFKQFVNPLIAIRAELSGEPHRIVRTDGGRLVDDEGRAFEDFHGTQAFGHRHPAITAAVKRFLDGDSPNWYPARMSPYAGRLARRLCERTGMERAFFAQSGAEAVEAALKLARAATRRPRILSLAGAYHGCTFGACALMDPGPFRDPFAPHLPGAESLPWNDVDALARAIGGDVAAVVVEPIQLEGGVRPLDDAYLSALCQLTAKHGALLVADEVQTGMGRTGRFVASSAWPRPPDAIVLGKALGGGLMPLSAMLTSAAWHERAYGNFETCEAHNVTFGGNALACVAALAALDLLDDALLARIRAVGDGFRGSLAEALAGSPLLEEVRGAGLVVGVALRKPDHPWLSFEHLGLDELAAHPTVGFYLCHRLYRRGYHCFVAGHGWNVLRLQPRYDIEPERLAGFVHAMREEMDTLAELL